MKKVRIFTFVALVTIALAGCTGFVEFIIDIPIQPEIGYTTSQLIFNESTAPCANMSQAIDINICYIENLVLPFFSDAKKIVDENCNGKQNHAVTTSKFSRGTPAQLSNRVEYSGCGLNVRVISYYGITRYTITR